MAHLRKQPTKGKEKEKKEEKQKGTQSLRSERIKYICDLLLERKYTEEEILELAHSGKFKNLNKVRLYRISEIRISLNAGILSCAQPPKKPIPKVTNKSKFIADEKAKLKAATEDKKADKKKGAKLRKKDEEKKAPAKSKAQPKKKKCTICGKLISNNPGAIASHRKACERKAAEDKKKAAKAAKKTTKKNTKKKH